MPTAVKSMPDMSHAPAEKVILRLSLTVVVEKDGDAFYAYVPAFKGIHVDGRTEREALANASEAAEVYLHSLVMHGDPLPIGPDCSILKEEKIPPIPAGAMLRHLELQWPSLNTSGIR
jgi:predicted RNase H-like HicB family nuclease